MDGRAIQRALAAAGCDPGPIDGALQARSYGALFDYAARRKLGAVGAAMAAVAWQAFPAHDLTTGERIAQLMANMVHETGGFSVWVEDLRYTAAELRAMWPTHFTASLAEQAAGDPQLIARIAYGGRMGNAPYPSQDGWTYRGRGAMQITGKAAYAEAATEAGLPLVEQPDLAADPADSVRIAAAFWRARGCNVPADRGDIAGVRRLLNGGSIGLQDVTLQVRHMRAVLLAA